MDIGELKLSLQDLAEKQAARAHKVMNLNINNRTGLDCGNSNYYPLLVTHTPPPPQRETYTNVSLVLKQLKEEVEKVLQIESRDTEMFNKAKTVQVDAFVCFMNSFY